MAEPEAAVTVESRPWTRTRLVGIRRSASAPTRRFFTILSRSSAGSSSSLYQSARSTISGGNTPPPPSPAATPSPGSTPQRPLRPLDVISEAPEEGWSIFDLTCFGYCITIILGLLAAIKELNGCWGSNATPRVVFGIMAAIASASFFIGIMTAGFRCVQRRRRKLSAFCARLCMVLSTDMLMSSIFCLVGLRGGWVVAGHVFVAVVAIVLIAFWVCKNRCAAEREQLPV